MKEVVEVNDADCRGIAHRLIRGLWLDKVTLGSDGRVDFASRSRVRSANLTLPGAIRYPTLVEASRALVGRNQTLVCA
jgi:hypothetical protein